MPKALWIVLVVLLASIAAMLFETPDATTTECLVYENKVVLNEYGVTKLVSSTEFTHEGMRRWEKGMGKHLYTVEGQFGFDYYPDGDYEILKVFSRPASFYRQYKVEHGCYQQIRQAWK